MFERPDQVPDPLYVATVVFNPIRYRTRWRLYQDFAYHMEATGAILYTVEIAFGNRAFAVTDSGNPYHIQLRSPHELWLKENALNLAIARFPQNWKYGAIFDADLCFARSDIANEIIHQLQHYMVVQAWSEAQELNPRYEVLENYKSFMWCFMNGESNGTAPWNRFIKSGSPRAAGPSLRVKDDYYYISPKIGKYHYWHPGYGWAFRREAFDALGGLIDWAVLGGGDLYMARALSGINRQLPISLGDSGRNWLQQWQKRCDLYIKRNIGYVDGLVLTYYHGPKHSRAYKDRGQILVDAKFNPEKDLKRDWQGLWQLESDSVALRDGVRKYFRGRNEDSV